MVTGQEKTRRLELWLQRRVRCLLPDRVKVKALKGPGGQSECFRGHMCFTAKWRPRCVEQCCLHAVAACTAHDRIRCEVGAAVLHADADACLFPEFRIRVDKRDSQGRFASGPTHSIDLLVVLGNGALLAFEIDGASHDRVETQARDCVKFCFLQSRDVLCHRVDVRKCDMPSTLSTELQLVYDTVTERM